MKLPHLTFALLIGLTLVLTACNAEPAGQAVTATVAPTDTPVPTVAPTDTPVPTVAPTDTPVPTAAPTDTPVPTVAPTDTPVPTPSPTASIRLGGGGEYFYPVRSAECSASSSHHDYPASDIFCPIGTEFVAVTDGVIDFISREDLYAAGDRDPSVRGGLSVAMIGDDGVRYYGSHLSAVAEGLEVGMRVSAGQLLGLTGKSGNAAGTPPHLHFGISPPTTPDDWAVRRGTIWPQPYLRAWAAGEAVTPDLSAP